MPRSEVREEYDKVHFGMALMAHTELTAARAVERYFKWGRVSGAAD